MINLPIGVLMVIGGLLVNFLYDPRYHEAGWMLQILCVRLLLVSMLAPSSSSLFALGMTKYSLIQNACRATMILSACRLPGICTAYTASYGPLRCPNCRWSPSSGTAWLHRISCRCGLSFRSVLIFAVGLAAGLWPVAGTSRRPVDQPPALHALACKVDDEYYLCRSGDLQAIFARGPVRRWPRRTEATVVRLPKQWMRRCCSTIASRMPGDIGR